jgi:cytochrome c oxidase cbb3-type subunit 4
MDIETIVRTARELWVVWLMLLFAGICVWAFLPRNKRRFEAHGAIPLRDEPEE